MYTHTFSYTDQADFVKQLDEMRSKLTDEPEMTPYHIIRARYPHLGDSAFSQRLKRFKGQFPRQMGPCGRKTVKLFVTDALDKHLRK